MTSFYSWQELLLPGSSNDFVEVTYNENLNITTYALKQNITINDNVIIENLTIPASIEPNSIFDGGSFEVINNGARTNGLFNTQVITTSDGTQIKPSNITIKRLGVVGGSTNTYQGFICGRFFGANAIGDINIEYCYSTGGIRDYCGGIVGANFCNGSTGGINVNIRYCYTTGKIGRGAGGLIGAYLGMGGFHMTIESCYTGSPTTNAFACGGIIGTYFYRSGLTSGSTIVMKNCYNSTPAFTDSQNYSTGSIPGVYYMDRNLNNRGTFEFINIFSKSGKYHPNKVVFITYDKADSDMVYIQKLDNPNDVTFIFTLPDTFSDLKSTAGFLSSVSTSGDPHIFPHIGKKYELPHTPNIYRLLQFDNLIVNASTKKMNVKQKNEIIHYFNYYDILDTYQLNKIIADGVLYDEIYICIHDVYTLNFNFNSKTLKLSKKAQEDNFFNLRVNKNMNSFTYDNAYEKSEQIYQLKISFYHNVLRNICIDCNFYSNPQIKYGIGFTCNKFLARYLDGLLIREYIANTMSVDKITNTTYINNGIIGKNKVQSKLMTVKLPTNKLRI